MKVLCITGSRADYGGIEATWLALKERGLEADLLSGMHELTHPDYRAGIDIVVVLGDRKEILQCVTDFFLEKKVICHLSGGDVTEGSQDDSMRHAITKLAHLHFPTSTHAARVLLQLGEEAWRIHMVGYPGADNMVTHDKEIADKLIGSKDYILVVWHPNTLVSNDEAMKEAKIVAEALEKVEFKKFVIGPNFDAGGYEISVFFEKWASDTGNKYLGKLPRDMYLTCLKYAKCLVGNSSSGYYEAPTFGTPVVNIGNRQHGRIVPPNMTCAGLEVDDIIEGINIASVMEQVLGRVRDNVYQRGDAAKKIAEVIANIKDPQALLTKKFQYITGHHDL